MGTREEAECSEGCWVRWSQHGHTGGEPAEQTSLKGDQEGQELAGIECNFPVSHEGRGSPGLVSWLHEESVRS